jgi:hypothetical protein
MTARAKAKKARSKTAAEIAERIVERRIAYLVSGPDEFCGFGREHDAQELIDAVKRENKGPSDEASRSQGVLWDAGFLLGVAVGRRIGGRS